MARVEPVFLEDGFSVQNADPLKANQILELAKLIFETSPYVLTRVDEFTMTIEQERDYLQRSLDSENSVFLVLEKDGTPIGLHNIGLPRAKRMGHYASLGASLHPDWRGKGLCQKLMEVGVDWCKSHPKISILSLEVMQRNIHAIKLYKKLGFIEVARIPHKFICDDGEASDSILMHLSV